MGVLMSVIGVTTATGSELAAEALTPICGPSGSTIFFTARNKAYKIETTVKGVGKF